jgi:hypothetical protein
MLGSALAAITLSLSLSACSATVSIDPAADSNNPLCAAVSVRLPDTADGLARRTTDAQATAAWGTPSAVLFRCGLAPVTVSKLKCVTASKVDWLVDDSNAPNYRLITFARKPAMEVVIDSKKVSGVNVLDDLSLAVQQVPATDHCLG